MLKSIWFSAIAILLLFPVIAFGANRVPYLSSTKSDPGALCQAIDKKFSLTVDGFKKLGTLEKETVRPDSNYCYESVNQCRVYNLEFTDLSLQLLEKIPNQKAGVLTIKLMKSRRDLLDKIYVGQSLAEIESQFGIKIPKATSPIGIIGECIAVVLHHKNGRVTEFFLDCQSC